MWRAGFLAAAALACLGSVAAPHPAPPTTRPGTTPMDCGRCHTAILQEWQGSSHARAWTSPTYQKSLLGKEKAQLCHGCHAPASVLDRLGHRPNARPDGRDHGIDCAACHLRGDTVHGPFGAATAAHPTSQDPTFTDKGSNALCASCHATKIADVLPLAAEFAAAGMADRGKSCVGCHMPELTRPLAVEPDTGAATTPPRAGRSHALLGPDDAEFCGDAFAVRAQRLGPRIRVMVQNRTGHGVPGRVGREFAVTVRQRDGKGKTLAEHPWLFSSDNRLLVDEERQLELDAMPGTLALEVQIDHRLHERLVATVHRGVLEIP